MVAAVSSQRSRRAASPAEQPAKRLKHSHNARPDGVDAFKSDVLELKKNKAPAKAMGKRFDESRAVVGNGATENGDVGMDDEQDEARSVLSISSDGTDPESGDEDDDLDRRPNGTSRSTKAPRLKDESSKSQARKSAEAAAELSLEDTAAAFQSIFDKAFPDGPIDVEAALESDDENLDSPANQLVHASTAVSSVPNATTLTTVLTQALRTNDSALLESCLSLNDLDSIRGTIEKLPSPLVASLITRLAERMYRRPGRAGNLMVWVQWALVAHGGYLASQPDVLEMLKRVKSVTSERAAGLPLLLELKGRLDMLSAQLELRRGVEARVRAERGDGQDDEAVIYVEGEESSSEDEEAAEDEKAEDEDLGEAETSGDDMDIPNGVAVDGSDEEDEDSEADQLIDDEAEETDEDEDNEEESEDAFDDDADDGEELSDEEVVEKPMKRSMAAGKSGFSRR